MSFVPPLDMKTGSPSSLLGGELVSSLRVDTISLLTRRTCDDGSLGDTVLKLPSEQQGARTSVRLFGCRWCYRVFVWFGRRFCKGIENWLHLCDRQSFWGHRGRRYHWWRGQGSASCGCPDLLLVFLPLWQQSRACTVE